MNLRNFLFAILTSFLIYPFLFINSNNAFAFKAADFNATPPFMSAEIPPNIIFALDISGSMKEPAYEQNGVNWKSGTHTNFAPSVTYFGYFDSSQDYVYDTSKGFFRLPEASETGDWNGNFMNWLASRRIDVARKVMVGGKVSVKTLDQECDKYTDSNGNGTWDSGESLTSDINSDGDYDCSPFYSSNVSINRNRVRNWTAANGYTPWKTDWDEYWVLEGQHEPSDRQFYKQLPASEQTVQTASSTYFPSSIPPDTIFQMVEGQIIPQTTVTSVVTKLSNEVEVGKVALEWDDAGGEIWTTVHFANDYTNPIIVAKPMSENGGDPAMVRIRNISGVSDSFEIRIDEWDYLTDNLHTSEEIMYMVVESGHQNIILDGGLPPIAIDAQKITNFSSCGSSNFQTPSYSSNFGVGVVPVLFTGVATFNGSSGVVTRNKTITNSTFQVVMQEEENNSNTNCTHSAETIHAIALTPGSGTSSSTGAQIEIGQTGTLVTSSWSTITFGSPFSSTPFVVMDMQTTEGSDTANLRYRNNNETTIQVHVDEEKSANTETGHTAEDIGYLAVTGGGTYNIRVGIKEDSSTSESEEPTGVIQDFEDSMRIGLAVYNYDHTKNPTNIYDGNKVHGGTLYPCYPDTRQNSSDRTNYDICLPTGVNNPVENIYQAIEEHPLIWGTTPIAETLFEIMNYIKQSDADGDGDWTDGDGYYDDKSTAPTFPAGVTDDPYYYPEDGTRLSCAKTYVLHFNDGEPYRDWDNAQWTTSPTSHPAIGDYDNDSNSGLNEELDDLALYVRQNDLRSYASSDPRSLAGHQEIISYYVYSALGEDDAYVSSTRKVREAAVNGGFDDLDGDHTPNVAHGTINTYSKNGLNGTPGIQSNDPTDCPSNEWDLDTNCEPDTFYFASDGNELVSVLTAAFKAILSTSSGTAASVVSNTRSGEGAIYQSIFHAAFKDNMDEAIPSQSRNNITWAGQVHALFVDSYGNMREDTPEDANGNGILDYGEDTDMDGHLDHEEDQNENGVFEPNLGEDLDGDGHWDHDEDIDGDDLLDTEDINHNDLLDLANQKLDPHHDKIISFDGANVTKYSDTDGNSQLDDNETSSGISGYDFRDINYLWNSSKWLNEMSETNAKLQRNYNSTDQKRYIFTFLDRNGNGIPDSNEITPFNIDLSNDDKTDLSDFTKIYPYIQLFPNYADKPTWVTMIETDSGANVFPDFLWQQTQRVTEWIRGIDQPETTIIGADNTYTIPAMRSRKSDYDNDKNLTTDDGVNDGSNETWRLGDVVYSTPTAVGRPADAYHLLYRDATYADFAAQYNKRRNVIYVGANDGMIHAFNGGFYDTSINGFLNTYHEPFTDNDNDGTSDPSDGNSQWDSGEPYIDLNGDSNYSPALTAFEIGQEIWAYIPYNLLPHIYWLTEEDYPHVYFNDLKPRVFDAKIFTPDSIHPHGWGTVMVMGMRFGGGRIHADIDKTDGGILTGEDTNQNGRLDTGEDSNGNGILDADRIMSSSYVIFDITNPEQPPTLMAELNFPDLGYTTSYPTVVPMRGVKDASGNFDTNLWYLVFGSGPAETDGSPGQGDSLLRGESNQTAKLYVVDLVQLVSGTIETLDSSGINSTTSPFYYQALDSNAFITDPITVDFDLDFNADAVYFGTISGDESSGWGGKMRRIVIDNQTTPILWDGNSTLIDLGSITFTDWQGSSTGISNGQPITSAPSMGKDENDNLWVFFGTGRFFNRTDASNSDLQSYYGIKEPLTAGNTPSWATVLRSDLLNVTNAEVFDNQDVDYVAGASTFSDLNLLINSMDGWFLDFPDAKERNLGQPVLLGDVLSFTTYVPDADICEKEGNSYLYALYYKTGTAYYSSILGSECISNCGDPLLSLYRSYRRITLGQGLALTPNIHVGRQTGSKAFIQTSTGGIIVEQQDTPGETKSGVQSWRAIGN